MIKKLTLMMILLFFIAICLFFTGKWWLNSYAQKTIDVDRPTLLTLPTGTGRIGLEKILLEMRIVSDTTAFPYLLKFYPELSQFKAGTYLLEPNMTIKQLLILLKSGKEAQFTIRFIEGTKMRDWLSVIAQAPEIEHTLSGLTERQIAEKLGIKAPVNPEGWLYPDTYRYTAGTTDLAILQRAYKRMATALQKEWEGRAEKLPYSTPYEMLIMSSIIEKETGVGHERTKVASVFINRLRAKMRLQTDPTVIYGMGESYKGTITRKDLNTATPYNTYIIDGLPPTPIAMPSIAAVKAAAHPDSTDYYYFVATGNGGHTFSKDLKGHNQAVSHYRKIMANQRAS